MKAHIEVELTKRGLEKAITELAVLLNGLEATRILATIPPPVANEPNPSDISLNF